MSDDLERMTTSLTCEACRIVALPQLYGGHSDAFRTVQTGNSAAVGARPDDKGNHHDLVSSP